MSNSYPLGNAVTLTGNFTTLAGAPVDPTTVVLILKNNVGMSSQSLAAGTVTRLATGQYSAVVTPLVSGLWQYRWAGTGACTAALDGSFTVLPSSVVAG